MCKIREISSLCSTLGHKQSWAPSQTHLDMISQTLGRMPTLVRRTFSYGIRHVSIVIHWTMTHSSLNHNENMPYPVWKWPLYGSPHPPYWGGLYGTLLHSYHTGTYTVVVLLLFPCYLGVPMQVQVLQKSRYYTVKAEILQRSSEHCYF